MSNVYLLPTNPHEDPAYGPFEDYVAADQYRSKHLSDGLIPGGWRWIISSWVHEPIKPKTYIEIVLRKDVTNDDGWELFPDATLPKEWLGDDPISIPGPWHVVENRRVSE